MAAPSHALEVIVVVDSSGGSSRSVVDRIVVCSYVYKMGGVVIMLTMCLIPSSNASCVMFGVGCAWVFFRLSRARCLRKMAMLRSVRMSLLAVFGQDMPRGFLWLA